MEQSIKNSTSWTWRRKQRKNSKRENSLYLGHPAGSHLARGSLHHHRHRHRRCRIWRLPPAAATSLPCHLGACAPAAGCHLLSRPPCHSSASAATLPHVRWRLAAASSSGRRRSSVSGRPLRRTRAGRYHPGQPPPPGPVAAATSWRVRRLAGQPSPLR